MQPCVCTCSSCMEHSFILAPINKWASFSTGLNSHAAYCTKFYSLSEGAYSCRRLQAWSYPTRFVYARQTPEARPSTHRSTDYAPPLWCGHPKSHLYPSGIRHSQWSCPSQPGSQFTILLGPGLGAKWRKKNLCFVFFLLW